ncbi:MAG: IPT/TIG domain-containing protein, partial [Dehalococcoidales bacterium]
DGPRDVSVTTLAGVSTLANGFIVEKVLGPPIAAPPPPSITSINPASAGIGDETTVVITGNNLSGAMGLGFAGMLISSYTVDSPTQITAVIHIPPDYAGPPVVDFSVTTPGGVATLDNGFTVEEAISPPAPTAPEQTPTTPEQTPTAPEQTPTAPEQTPTTPGLGLSCERSPSPQASGSGGLIPLLGVVSVCFGLRLFRRR